MCNAFFILYVCLGGGSSSSCHNCLFYFVVTVSLLAQVFDRFEEENGGELLVATLCLLECSNTGLLETELLTILGDEDNLMPNASWFSPGAGGEKKGK